MPSPFPGMNPYLESNELGPELHHWLITLLAGFLVARLRPKYRVAIEHRIFKMVDRDAISIGIPDVTVARSNATSQKEAAVAIAEPLAQPHQVQIPLLQEVQESYLEVREATTGLVVTAIEFLSPKNKRAGEGRIAYEEKRLQVLGSQAHLVEIDLLRAGEPMPTVQQGVLESDYRILVSRSNRRPSADLYTFSIRNEIPRFPLPLQAGDTEPIVDLQALLHRVYDEAGLDLAVDYTQPPPKPAISAEDWQWCQALLAGER